MKDDTISRVAAVSEIESIVDTMSVCMSMDECKGMRRMKETVLERITALPSAQLAQDLPKGCTDMISRQAAIQTAERMYRRCDTSSIEDYHDLMVDALTELPPAQPGWIPCSVALPEKEGVYLVTDSTAYGAKISLRYWNRHTAESFWSGYESDVVTAWMPLPTPYRKGDTDAR